VIAVGVPLAQLVRGRPEAYGWTPDGDLPRQPGANEPARPVSADPDFTVRQALATRAFWCIALGHGTALLVVSAVLVHMIVHVTERLGYSLEQAGAVVALMTVMQATGQLSGGWLGDRFSKRRIAAGCMLAHAVGLLVLALATAFWMVLVFAVLHGVGWGMRGPLMSAIRADYFGSAAFGRITGMSSMVVMFGMMGGPIVAGALADRTGSYVVGFSALAALAALGSIFFLVARRPSMAR
jgi:MFS family permease